MATGRGLGLMQYPPIEAFDADMSLDEDVRPLPLPAPQRQPPRGWPTFWESGDDSVAIVVRGAPVLVPHTEEACAVLGAMLGAAPSYESDFAYMRAHIDQAYGVRIEHIWRLENERKLQMQNAAAYFYGVTEGLFRVFVPVNAMEHGAAEGLHRVRLLGRPGVFGTGVYAWTSAWKAVNHGATCLVMAMAFAGPTAVGRHDGIDTAKCDILSMTDAAREHWCFTRENQLCALYCIQVTKTVRPAVPSDAFQDIGNTYRPRTGKVWERGMQVVVWNTAAMYAYLQPCFEKTRAVPDPAAPTEDDVFRTGVIERMVAAKGGTFLYVRVLCPPDGALAARIEKSHAKPSSLRPLQEKHQVRLLPAHVVPLADRAAVASKIDAEIAALEGMRPVMVDAELDAKLARLAAVRHAFA